MKALRFHKAFDLRLDEVAEPPAPQRDEVLLKVKYCGICGTDLHEYVAGPIILPVQPHPITKAQIPIILGHEFSAMVAAVGPDVKAVTPGDRVCILPHLMAPGDYFARRNLGQFSSATGLVGLTWWWGGFGQLAIVPEQNVVKLPDLVSDEQGALVEPAAVALNAIDYAEVKAGMNVLVTGAGPIGALTAMAAKAAGASRVFVYEPSEGRRKRLQAVGGLDVFGSSVDELQVAIRGATEAGVGVDCAIECAGHHEALSLCLDLVKRTGVIAQVGLFVEPPRVDIFKLCEKGVRIVGCWGNDITLGPRLVGLIASGRFPVEKIITGRVSLADAVSEGFQRLTAKGNDHLKILVDVSGEP